MAGALKRLSDWLHQGFRYRRAFFILYFIFLVIYWLIFIHIWNDGMPYLLLFGIIIFLPLKSLLHEWRPIILIISAYGAMQGFSEQLLERVNITNIISWEQRLFSELPTIKLQSWLHSVPVSSWYDHIFVIIYLSYFIIAIIVAIILWNKHRPHFNFFMDGLIILTIAGYVTYILFPAMPPWMASQLEYLPKLNRILIETIQNGLGLDLPSIYSALGANNIAAMPSIHAAWPWLVSLCLIYFYRWKAVWSLGYPLLMWLTVIYFGEHYAVDVIAGIIYASGAFGLIYFWWRRSSNLKRAYEETISASKS